jgi:hypothetical protein
MFNLNKLYFKGKEPNLPKIRCVEQKTNDLRIKDIKNTIHHNLSVFGLKDKIQPGEIVAITGSSRGITNQDQILKAIVDYIKELNAHPFIFPAMGSHGGATAEGQSVILKEYGITEDTMGCPIKSSMDVIEIGKSEFNTPIFIDKHAQAADKIIIVNKIKTHSKFVGEIESGLCKMCLLGLGKHKGAKLYHRLIDQYSWLNVISSIIKTIINTIPIVCGVALIQNNYNELAEIHILEPEEFLVQEPFLLDRYKKIMPNIPFSEIDLLIVDEMGKNIFGTGMDTYITGRKPSSNMNVKWLFVRDLTEETKGNSQGLGLADFTTLKLVNKIDLSKMYSNALTAYRTDSPKIPIFLKNDMDVIYTIFDLAGIEDPSIIRVVWIKNTLKLSRIIVSEYFFEQVESREDLNFIGEPESIEFDSEGFLINSNKYWVD